MEGYRTYPRLRRGPVVDWLLRGLEAGGCRILSVSDRTIAPFRIVFEAPDGERLGAIFYAFTSTSKVTQNRPTDEWRFQLKYGSRDGLLHELWQDPSGLYTTVLLGIDPKTGCWVAADPILHSPTLMFISVEFKVHHMEQIKHDGWCAWERESTKRIGEPIEVLVGGRPERLLSLVRFERAAKGLDQGHRQLLAESIEEPSGFSEPAVHQLAAEFEMSPDEILGLISAAPRLKMAVRGWVAEDHLRRTLSAIDGVTQCDRLNVEGAPDIRVVFKGRALLVECKNVLRQTLADGTPRMDFQRTRASQADPCSRYYKRDEFNLLAACLHAVTEEWEFKYRLPATMDAHKTCPGRLSQNVRIDMQWNGAEAALAAAMSQP
jgi:hypothetical protein